MKRLLLVGILALAIAPWGSAQSPDQGAVLKQPWDMPIRPSTTASAPIRSAPSSQGMPGALQGLWKELGGTESDRPRDPYSLAPNAQLDINRDIEVNPSLGPWMIFVTSYTSNDAPIKARQMVAKLREHYKLPAYVFNYGSEEKRQEYDRLKTRFEQQKEALQKQSELLKSQLPGQEISVQPINIRTTRIQEQCGILVGGFKDEDTARRIQEQIRKLDPKMLLDPNTVRLLSDPSYTQAITDPLLESQYFTHIDPKTKQPYGETSFINPFKKAFVVRNPSMKHEKVADNEKYDIAILRKLNDVEPLTVLNCKKPYTLVIKQFQTPVRLNRPEDKVTSLIQSVGFMREKEDLAAENAHNLAEALRKSKLESYVLHTRFASVVCVGNYESLEDPNLRSMQNLLENRLKIDSPMLQLMARPMPMLIPR